MKTSITVRERVTIATPAHVSVLDTAALAETPGVNLDDRLRNVPGFALFRRSSSLVAHPTTQGVSLRGLGSTGASRTLVLKDGAPLNDPFGGWVYWTRLIPDEIAAVESQFEDERNQFLLPGFATVQLLARRRLAGRLTALAALENLLDRTYLTGFSPTPTTGAPRLWRVGLRWEGQLP